MTKDSLEIRIVVSGVSKRIQVHTATGYYFRSITLPLVFDHQRDNLVQLFSITIYKLFTGNLFFIK